VCRLETVQNGHGDVEDIDICRKLIGMVKDFLTVGALAHNLNVQPAAFDAEAQTVSHEQVIVRNHDTDTHDMTSFFFL